MLKSNPDKYKDVYKKKKVCIRFEVIEYVGEDGDTQNIDEWINRLHLFAKHVDRRAEFEITGVDEYGHLEFGKLISSPAEVEITDIGCLHEDETNTDELWKMYGGDGSYYWFNGFDVFLDEAKKVINEVFHFDLDEHI